MPMILEDGENGLSSLGRELFHDLYEQLVELDKKIASYDKKLEQLFNSNPLCKKLAQVEGVGPVSATAFVAAVGDGRAFKNGREVAAWLGLVPRQHSSGDKQRLQGISKRGDSYVRMLLIHGARSVVKVSDRKQDKRSSWINAIKARRNNNIASVALANKNARVLWALLTKEDMYRCVT